MAAEIIQVHATPRPAEASRHVPRVDEPFALVIFGATGDLTSRKLLPALFHLWKGGYLAAPFAILGHGRRAKSDTQFRDEVRTAVSRHLPDQARAAWDDFAARLFYHAGDLTRAEDYHSLKERLESLEKEHHLGGNRLFYLAVDPDHFATAVEHLGGAELVRRGVERPWTRVVLEKPFGKDLASAQALDAHLHRFLDEHQIFRIDHYLGKETVQNLLSFRFGNAIFEPIFNRRYVDHVQITVAETVGMEGRRGAYYDGAGAIRDMIQNHVLQLLALTAMEPPAMLQAKEIRDEKVKVLRSVVPCAAEVDQYVIRGQYGAGRVSGQDVPAYRAEEGVEPSSITETFVALALRVDNWRWAGVPFLLRTGKRLAARVTEIAVEFKLPPLRLFTTVHCDGDQCDVTDARPNVLVFRIQPDEGISLSFAAKRPGMQFDLHMVEMDFLYNEAFPQSLPEAYERLLLDALRGDATLFMRSDEVESAWTIVTPILEAWSKLPPPTFPNYAAGSFGPDEANRLTRPCQHRWRPL